MRHGHDNGRIDAQQTTSHEAYPQDADPDVKGQPVRR
jgi:hypothetical protein